MENKEKEKKPINKKILICNVIILIVLVAIISGGQSNKSETTGTNPDNEKQITQPEKTTEEILTVDYKTLHKEYMDNPIAADAKYKNKTLQLTGEVYNIDREIMGNTYITFYIDTLEDVRITFKKSEESKVAELKKGQKISIKGKCIGTLLSTTVALNECEIVE